MENRKVSAGDYLIFTPDTDHLFHLCYFSANQEIITKIFQSGKGYFIQKGG